MLYPSCKGCLQIAKHKHLLVRYLVLLRFATLALSCPPLSVVHLFVIIIIPSCVSSKYYRKSSLPPFFQNTWWPTTSSSFLRPSALLGSYMPTSSLFLTPASFYKPTTIPWLWPPLAYLAVGRFLVHQSGSMSPFSKESASLAQTASCWS